MASHPYTAAPVAALVLCALNSATFAATDMAPTAETTAGKGLSVMRASIEAGNLVVMGTTPRANQVVVIDGRVRARSNAMRVFSLSRLYHPDDCVIGLKAGLARAEAVVQFCAVQGEAGSEGKPGRTGPRGPRGATGKAGDPGPAGTPGKAGPDGEAGPVGDAGPAGPAGARGPRGDAGPVGETGPKGATGPAGPDGPQGATGAQGAPGPDGPPGPIGPTGATGAQGFQGPQGAPGPIGTVGPAGPIGQQGNTGSQGAQGDPGGSPTVVAFQSATPAPVPPISVRDASSPLPVTGEDFYVTASFLVETPAPAATFDLEVGCFHPSTNSVVSTGRQTFEAGSAATLTRLDVQCLIHADEGDPNRTAQVEIRNHSATQTVTLRGDLLPYRLTAIDVTPRN